MYDRNETKSSKTYCLNIEVQYINQKHWKANEDCIQAPVRR